LPEGAERKRAERASAIESKRSQHVGHDRGKSNKSAAPGGCQRASFPSDATTALDIGDSRVLRNDDTRNDDNITSLAGVIRRQLEHRLAAQIVDATSYLAAYGDTPGARFRSLCASVDDHGKRHPSHPALIVAAANEACRCQRQWYGAEAEPREVAPKRVGILRDRSTLST
jgi:hypothetical protein